MAAFLPRDTIFLAHMPDFNRTRDEWRRVGYLSALPRTGRAGFSAQAAGQHANPEGSRAQTLQEIEQLDPKKAFFALTSISDSAPSFVGGFRFRGTQEDAERSHRQMARDAFGTTSRHEERETSVSGP